MGWFTKFIQSSIGKKVLMATTGILLSFFLVMHLIGNLTLFGGAEMFNTYVIKLSSMKPVVRFSEVILTLIFLAHIINGFNLTRKNKLAKPIGYELNTNAKRLRNLTQLGGYWQKVLILNPKLEFINLNYRDKK